MSTPPFWWVESLSLPSQIWQKSHFWRVKFTIWGVNDPSPSKPQPQARRSGRCTWYWKRFASPRRASRVHWGRWSSSSWRYSSGPPLDGFDQRESPVTLDGWWLGVAPFLGNLHLDAQKTPKYGTGRIDPSPYLCILYYFITSLGYERRIPAYDFWIIWLQQPLFCPLGLVQWCFRMVQMSLVWSQSQSCPESCNPIHTTGSRIAECFNPVGYVGKHAADAADVSCFRI